MDEIIPGKQSSAPSQRDPLDPNFSGGYQGMRMSGGHGRAAYGSLRVLHSRDLESVGGFDGIHGADRTGPLPSADVAPPSSGPATSGNFGLDFNSGGPQYRGDAPIG